MCGTLPAFLLPISGLKLHHVPLHAFFLKPVPLSFLLFDLLRALLLLLQLLGQLLPECVCDLFLLAFRRVAEDRASHHPGANLVYVGCFWLVQWRHSATVISLTLAWSGHEGCSQT